MQDYNRFFDIEDMFANLFFLAGKYGIKKDVFTRKLEKTRFASMIEKGDFNQAYNESVLEVFNDMFSLQLSSGDDDEEWNEFYWVGKMYFYIQSETHKSFSYIFIKLPFEKLLNMYKPYHEMDVSHILNVFKEEEIRTTILKELCSRRKISINRLSKETDIPESTLTKYRKADSNIYKASFVNIYRLARYFTVPETLFLESIPQEK